MDHKHTAGTVDGRIEQAKDAALGPHKGPPSTADEIGEAAGGISGTLLGAGAGAPVGPFGALIGGIIGAISGWWTGRAVTEAAEKLADADDTPPPRRAARPRVVERPRTVATPRTLEREVERTVADEVPPRRPDERRS